LFVRLYLQLFVGGLMYCFFVFTSSCLEDGSCIVCSSLPPVVCRRARVLFVRLYLQLFVGGLMYCLFVFTSSCSLKVKTNKQYISTPANNLR
jgi:hypothetical protein